MRKGDPPPLFQFFDEPFERPDKPKSERGRGYEVPPAINGDSLEAERLRVSNVRKDYRRETHCRACRHFVKTYRWGFHSTLARGMIKLVRQHERTGDWVHVPSLEKQTHCLTRAACWGLIEKCLSVEKDPKRRASGLWRPTQKGIDFVRERIRIPSHMLVTNNTVLGFSARDINIREASKKAFDYDKMMRGED